MQRNGRSCFAVDSLRVKYEGQKYARKLARSRIKVLRRESAREGYHTPLFEEDIINDMKSQ